MFKIALKIIYNVQNCLIDHWYCAMDILAFYQIINNVQNCYITGIGDMSKFIFYQIYNVHNCLITDIDDMGRYSRLSHNKQCPSIYTMFKTAGICDMSLFALLSNIQCSKLPNDWHR